MMRRKGEAMDAKAHWTPVGTYAMLTALLVAVGLGAAGVMYVAEHPSTSWSTIPAQAQRFAIGVDGAGLVTSLLLVGLLLSAFSMVDVRPDLRFPLHLGLVALLVAGVVIHVVMATLHVASLPVAPVQVALVVLGVLAVCLIAGLATTGALIKRGSTSKLPRLLHAPFAIAVGLLVTGHIAVAVSGSVMHAWSATKIAMPM
jgi:hypothetical protein